MCDRKWYQERLPLIQAYAEGKTIQAQHFETGKWVDMSYPAFTNPVAGYRVKPEPVMIDRHVCLNCDNYLILTTFKDSNVRLSFDPDTGELVNVERI